MNNSKAQFTQASEESIATTREVLKTSLSSIEKLTKLNLDASKKFLEETTQALKEMTKITNPKELFEKVNKLASHTVESNMSSCRDVYEIISETQSKIGKMLEAHMHTAQKNITDAAENFSKLNPAAKSGFSSDAIKSWINSTNQAMETLNKMASQVSEFTNNSIKSSTGAATSTVRKTTKK